MHVVGVDPGAGKCGLALVHENGTPLAQHVVDTAQLPHHLRQWAREYKPLMVAIGDGTGSKAVMQNLLAVDWGDTVTEFVFVDETDSTLEARRMYFRHHPPRGWRRLLPVSMQVPPVPYDDYTAVIIARRFLERLKYV